jgi:hypothetical protein
VAASAVKNLRVGFRRRPFFIVREWQLSGVEIADRYIRKVPRLCQNAEIKSATRISDSCPLMAIFKS